MINRGSICPDRSKIMNTNTDYTKAFQDMLANFPVDTQAFQNAFKTQAVLTEKMSRVALEAAEKSTEISAKWAKDTFARIGEVSRAKTEPTEYTKAASDFATSAAEIAAENMAAFAEVAKKVQMETVELMLAAGKDISEDVTSAAKKATSDVTYATRKAATNASPV